MLACMHPTRATGPGGPPRRHRCRSAICSWPNGPFTVPLVRQCTQDAGGTTTRISGTVTYGDTELPASGVTVAAPHPYKSQSATTQADGTYVIDRVLLGYNETPTDYTVSASLPQGHPREWYYESKSGHAHIDACGDRREVNLVLPAIPMGSIEGFVIDDDGDTVPNAQIGITSSSCRPCITTEAKSDALGHYRIFDIPAPSTWGIQYFDQFETPFWDSTAESVSVVAGQATRHDVHIIRKRHATVRGTVQDAITGLRHRGGQHRCRWRHGDDLRA